MPVKSPCKGKCYLDKRKVCIGCVRDIETIRNWSILTDEEKLDILKSIKDKKKC